MTTVKRLEDFPRPFMRWSLAPVAGRTSFVLRALPGSWENRQQIEIEGSPISSIRLTGQTVAHGDTSTTLYTATYYVGDRWLLNRFTERVNATTIRKRSFPLFGPVRGVRWTGSQAATVLGLV